MADVKHDFEMEKNKVIKAAKDLQYPEYVIKKLRAAKTPAEINNIMKDARNRE